MTRRLDAAVNGIQAVADGSALPTISRGLMVAEAGDVAVTFAGTEEEVGNIVVLPALQPGIIYAVQVARIHAAGTTASGIVALW